MKLKNLALEILVAGFFSLSVPAHAGIPVIDGTNLVQNIMTAIEEVAQTLKQIEQHQTQLQQYENQLLNTLVPDQFIWSQAQQTINNLMRAVDTLNYYKNTFGSLEGFLNKYRDVSYYRNSPCFNGHGEACTPEERAQFEEDRRMANANQKRANDAVFRGLERQQETLEQDAQKLEELQSAAQSAEGQMQALGYANQLASHKSNQLLQIRSLLLAQHAAITAKMQADADLEAQTQAIHEAMTRTNGSKTLRGNYKSWDGKDGM